MMGAYVDLSGTVQILFLTVQFLTLCFGVCLLAWVSQKRRWLHRGILTALILLSGWMLTVFSAHIRVQKTTMPLPDVTGWAINQPVWMIGLLMVGILCYMAFLLFREILYRKQAITQFSIKDGLDRLSSGLCFYEPSGRVILANCCMQELCYKLMGCNLQNAAQFWQLLQKGEAVPGVICLAKGDVPSFQLPDGTVWSFSWEKLEGICQLTAADTTPIHDMTARLEQENRQLEQFNRRLRDYGQKADALTRARERLEIKVTVHGMLGQALLATRRYLLDERIPADEAMALWRHSVAVLHRESVQETGKPLDALIKAAEATGVTLVLKGQIPEEAKVRQLFLQAAAEALTNAISHARAKTLYVDFSEEPYSYCVTIYNDGMLPAGPIREGGGLGSLRRNTESIGGQMEIRSVPQFILTVTIGKGGVRDV